MRDGKTFEQIKAAANSMTGVNSPLKQKPAPQEQSPSFKTKIMGMLKKRKK